MYNLQQNFGIDLDLERDDIDEQIEQLRDVVLFSPDNHPGNVDFIKRNHRQLHEYSKRVAEYNGNHDRVFDWLMSVLPDGPFTHKKPKRWWLKTERCIVRRFLAGRNFETT